MSKEKIHEAHARRDVGRDITGREERTLYRSAHSITKVVFLFGELFIQNKIRKLQPKSRKDIKELFQMKRSSTTTKGTRLKEEDEDNFLFALMSKRESSSMMQFSDS